MQIAPFKNFTVIETYYGKLVVNRHNQLQTEHLIKFGIPHSYDAINGMLGVVNTLPGGCVIVDAGAHVGLASIPLALAVQDRGGVVLAFEVQRLMYYALCGAAVLNDLENLYVYHRGLGAADSTATMKVADYGVAQDFGQFSLVEPRDGQIHPRTDRAEEEVSIIPIDRLTLPRLDFMRIDVEGMEADVLAGARGMIQAHRPWCWINARKLTADRIKPEFAALTYKFYQVGETDILCAPLERMISANTTINAPEI